MANFTGNAGNDTLTGTGLDDTFDITQGGADTVNAGLGDDVINAGATFDALDKINGQGDDDVLKLEGDYAAGVTLGSLTLRGVEMIQFGSGFSYKLTLNNATVAADTVLKIDGYSMSAGQSLYIDGSAETNGSFLVYDGMSDDTFIGGAQGDDFAIGYNGADKVYGGAGGDVITANGAFSNADIVDGGAGDDVLYLRGDYSAGLSISATAMTSVETLGLLGDFVFALSVADGSVAAGQELYVSGGDITGSGHLIFNGAAETDGSFSIVDSIGDDNLSGGANADTFIMSGGGDDILLGLAGDDQFRMKGNLDALDQIYGGTGDDEVNLDGDYSAGVVFDEFTINSVEQLTVAAGNDYVITFHDANVGPGKQLLVWSSGLGAGDTVLFNGSAETDGSFKLVGGAGTDNFSGGMGDDVFSGGPGGSDVFIGRGGNDEGYGGNGNDSFSGDAGDDYFDGSQGGNDLIYGGDNDDAVSFFNAFTTSDFVDGGAGNDRMYFYGSFAGGLTLSGATIQNVEFVTLGDGFSYNVTTTNSLVAAGATMAFNTYYSLAGQNFIFNGSAETDGHFELTGGDGNDQLTGGSKADHFFLNRAGNDVMNGGGGDDLFSVSSGFTAADKLNGGAGVDSVYFGVSVGGGLTLGVQTLIGIERIDFATGQGYTLTSHDGNVASNALLTVDAHFLEAGHVLSFNGSAESNGRFSFLGGAAADILRGGAKNDLFSGGDGNDKLYGNNGVDTLTGGLGADDLYGGNGNDKFVFTDIAQTTVADSDTVKDWNAGDKIDLSAVDANSGMAGDQAFSFIGAAAFSGVAGQLQVTAGAMNTFVKGDVDGNGTADFMITVAGTPALGVGAFVL
jgi:Ca2+-binding RTX toxin-like protein